MAPISDLTSFFHHRWSAPLLAELRRTNGSKFVTLRKRLGVNRDSLQRSLTVLIEAGLVERNPGYGHPMRPEYVLTSRGERVGDACLPLVAKIMRLGLAEAALKKWYLPTLAAIAAGEVRFSNLQSLTGASPRALALSLKDLEDTGAISRVVEASYPPSTSYKLSARGRTLVESLMRLQKYLNRPQNRAQSGHSRSRNALG